MQRALIGAKNLKVITHLARQFRSNLSTQTNLWATAVTLDSKLKVRLIPICTPIFISLSFQFVIFHFGILPLPLAAPPLCAFVPFVDSNQPNLNSDTYPNY